MVQVTKIIQDCRVTVSCQCRGQPDLRRIRRTSVEISRSFQEITSVCETERISKVQKRQDRINLKRMNECFLQKRLDDAPRIEEPKGDGYRRCRRLITKKRCEGARDVKITSLDERVGKPFFTSCRLKASRLDPSLILDSWFSRHNLVVCGRSEWPHLAAPGRHLSRHGGPVWFDQQLFVVDFIILGVITCPNLS